MNTETLRQELQESVDDGKLIACARCNGWVDVVVIVDFHDCPERSIICSVCADSIVEQQ